MGSIGVNTGQFHIPAFSGLFWAVPVLIRPDPARCNLPRLDKGLKGRIHAGKAGPEKFTRLKADATR